MSYFSINGLIGFFDLRNILCDGSKDRDELIFKYKCRYGIKLYFFNNYYWLIDFSESKIESMRPHLETNSIQDFKNARGSIAINLQKEVINALNACIYSIQRDTKPRVTCADDIKRHNLVNGIDQFFLPNTVEKLLLPLSHYINGGTVFSNRIYEIACQTIYNKEPQEGKLSLDVAKKSLQLLSHLFLEDKDRRYNEQPFYILSNLWKGIYYKNHDLRIDASILLRSVFESLVRSKYNITDKLKPCDYQQYCNSKEINNFFHEMSDIRADAVHELLIPGESLDQYAQYLVDFFNRDFDTSISGILR